MLSAEREIFKKEKFQSSILTKPIHEAMVEKEVHTQLHANSCGNS